MKHRAAMFSVLGKHLLVAAACILLALSFATSVVADDFDRGAAGSLPLQEKEVLLRKRIMSWHHNYVPPGFEYEDAVRFPLMYWHAWANQGVPTRTIFFILLITVLPMRIIFPGFVARFQIEYEQHWARSLGLGLLFLVFGGGCCGFLARTGLYAPLATLLLAGIQLTTLFGLTVACSSIGAGGLSILRIDKRIAKSKFSNIAPVCLGIFLCTLLTLVHGTTYLPGVGIRLVALIAAAGTGAVLVSMRKKGTD
jgi:hypothetical protein